MDACDALHSDMSADNYIPLCYINDYRIVSDKVAKLQSHIDELLSHLSLNEYGDLLHYFTEVCIPENSIRILEKFERRLKL